MASLLRNSDSRSTRGRPAWLRATEEAGSREVRSFPLGRDHVPAFRDWPDTIRQWFRWAATAGVVRSAAVASSREMRGRSFSNRDAAGNVPKTLPSGLARPRTRPRRAIPQTTDDPGPRYSAVLHDVRSW